jgi:hypothetical protein
MADKRIEDLPLLSQSSFQPSSDFVIIQTPGGGTFRMIAGDLFTALQETQPYVDSKNATVFASTSSSLSHVGLIEFNENNLISSGSSFSLDVTAEIVSHGSMHATQPNQWTIAAPTVGSQFSYKYTKSGGLDQINDFQIGGVSQEFNIANFTYIYKSPTSPSGITSPDIDLRTTYSISLDTSVSNKVKIMISSSSDNPTSVGSFLAANQMKFTATIQGALRP